MPTSYWFRWFPPFSQQPTVYAHVGAWEYVFLPSVIHSVVPGTGLEPVSLAAADFKSAAVANFATRALFVVPTVGIEPTTYALQVRCSTTELNRLLMVRRVGLEPTTNRL